MLKSAEGSVTLQVTQGTSSRCTTEFEGVGESVVQVVGLGLSFIGSILLPYIRFKGPGPLLNEPHHEKTCLCQVRTTKAQINLRIRAV